MSMNSEITRMAEMVNSLLEAARLNSGVASWHWGTVNFATTCAEALDVVRPLIDQSQLTLISSCEPEDLQGNGDPEAIRRLVVNLVNNAAKYTPSGSVSVTCRKLDHQSIELRVTDTGKGISPAIATRLGEPFALNSGPLAPITSRAPAWVWPSARASPPPMADRWSSNPPPAKEPRSSCISARIWRLPSPPATKTRSSGGSAHENDPHRR